MRYYRTKEFLYLLGLTILAAMMWKIIGKPGTVDDIYMGIGFEARPLFFMQFIAEYLIYVWSCMGMTQAYLKQGGIYRLIRTRRKGDFLFAICKNLWILIIWLEILRLLVYGSTFFLLEGDIQEVVDMTDFLKAAVIHGLVFYIICLFQMLLEFWMEEKMAFGIMWLIQLMNLKVGDFLYQGEISEQFLYGLPMNLTMTLRTGQITMQPKIFLTVLVIIIGLITGIFYITIRKRDFLSR